MDGEDVWIIKQLNVIFRRSENCIIISELRSSDQKYVDIEFC